MMYTLNEFNKLSKKKAGIELFNCCGSAKWVKQLLNYFPFENEELLFDLTRMAWYETCEKIDFLEAFSHHPRIGDVNSLRKKLANTKHWAGAEQAGVKEAQEKTIQELVKWNEKYFQKFGYIFIVCATGKTADEMLQLLKARMDHTKSEELHVAMGEQFKITLIRLKKLIKLKKSFWIAVSQITTHVLDTSVGTPGKGICIKLKKQTGKNWQTISLGITDEDGRITDLLPSGKALPLGEYQMYFDTKTYFQNQNKKGFYPKVAIHFETFDQTHYHVPLLINPFGYSTYRGS